MLCRWGPYCPFILYIIVFHLLIPNSQSIILPSLAWQPHVCFLCPWVCFCLMDKFICVMVWIPHIRILDGICRWHLQLDRLLHRFIVSCTCRQQLKAPGFRITTRLAPSVRACAWCCAVHCSSLSCLCEHAKYVHFTNWNRYLGEVCRQNNLGKESLWFWRTQLWTIQAGDRKFGKLGYDISRSYQLAGGPWAFLDTLCILIFLLVKRK